MKAHYIWIGPPKADHQDVRGPIEMRNNFGPEVEIHFWCLDAQVDAFAHKLRDVNKITHGIIVHGIESALRTATGTAHRWWYWYTRKEDWAVAEMLNIVTVSAGLGTTRDLVNAKNGFAYFLLYTWGGYVMDTNVMPLGVRAKLPDYDHFMSPVIGTDDTNMVTHDPIVGDWFPRWRDHQGGGRCQASISSSLVRSYRSSSAVRKIREQGNHEGLIPLPECWMLYSPQYNGTAWRALEAFICAWRDLVEIRKGPSREEYHFSCANAVIDSLIHAIAHDDRGQCVNVNRTHFWTGDKTDSRVDVRALGLTKLYNNTHKFRAA